MLIAYDAPCSLPYATTVYNFRNTPQGACNRDLSLAKRCSKPYLSASIGDYHSQLAHSQVELGVS